MWHRRGRTRAFIEQCQESLPDGCLIQALRIDAAGYQAKIIQYCDEKGIRYAIRAKMSPMIKSRIDALTEEGWMPLLDKQGKSVKQDQPIKTHN